MEIGANGSPGGRLQRRRRSRIRPRPPAGRLQRRRRSRIRPRPPAGRCRLLLSSAAAMALALAMPGLLPLPGSEAFSPPSPPSSAVRPSRLASHGTFGDGSLSSETFGQLYGDVLPGWLTDRCEEVGWPRPTLVQRRALDAILPGGDVVVQAQTGSGKTLAYLLPLLSGIDASRAAVQGIVVVPTRELGLQVSRVARRLAAASGPDNEAGGRIMVMPVLQGSANRRQRAWAWSEPPHVVVGTPEELGKMVGLGGIRYNAVGFVVVDEVDACLLNNGGSYANEAASLPSAGPLHELLSKYLSPTYEDSEGGDDDLVGMSAGELDRASRTVSYGTDRQTVFASATIPQHNHFMRQCVQNQWTVREPAHVCASPGELMPPTLSHSYAVCRGAENKFPGLRRMLRKEMGKGRLNKALVFCDPRRPMEEMAEALAASLGGRVWTENCAEDDQSASAIVSVLRYEDSLSARAAAMEAFRGPGDSGANLPAVEGGRGSGEEGSGEEPYRIMFSSDLAARGLDVTGVSHVVNYDLPNEGDTYVHRGGRAGRLGRRGSVLSLITHEQEFVLERLGNKLGLDLKCVARQEKKRRKKA